MKKILAEKILNRVKEFKEEGLTAKEIGSKLGINKNSIFGMLHRDKVKRGYIPKISNYFKKIGERNCIMCNENFYMYGKFDRFCDRCKRTSIYMSN